MEKLNKCPACGALRTSFTAVCPDCGYEYNDIEVSQTTHKFFEEIKKYDEAIALEEASGETKQKSAGYKVGMVLLWIFLFPIMLGYYLFRLAARNNPSGFKGQKKLKANAITAFPIPNSRNDLLETAMLMESQINKLSFSNVLSDNGNDIQMWNKTWLSKLGNIVKKAEVALKDDSASLNKIKGIFASSQEVVKSNEKLKWIELGILFALFFVFLLIASFTK